MAIIGFNAQDIARTYDTFVMPGNVVEIRVPKAGRFKTISGYYDNHDAFIAGLIKAGQDPSYNNFKGYYFTINPVKNALLARSYNRAKAYAEETTADKDVSARYWWPLDFDAVRPAGISSSDKEHEEAIKRAGQVRQFLINKLNWPKNAFVLADSGNGGHLPVRIDLPNDKESEDLIKRCTEAINKEFSDNDVKVDTTTYNAARIWKIYGTTVRKGDNTPDRPHRLARLLEVPDKIEVVPRELLEALPDQLQEMADPGAETSNEAASRRPIETAKGLSVYDEMAKACRFNAVEYAEKHGAVIRQVKQNGDWTVYELGQCPFNHEHNRGEAFISIHKNGPIAFKCHHNSCSNKGWHEVRDLWDPGWRERQPKAKAESMRAKCIDFDIDSSQIQVNDRYLQDITNDTLLALVAQNVPPQIFVRYGQLVRIVQNGHVAIELLNDHSLRGLMARAAGFVQVHNKNTNCQVVPTTPPIDVCKDILSLKTWPQFPNIESVIEAPMLRPDGSILIEPGYDKATCLYYVPGVGLDGISIPKSLTQEDAKKAADHILSEIIVDFPFKDNASKANAIAFLITGIVRYMVDGNVPLALFDKPQAGTGASFLVDVASTVLTGGPANMAGAPETEDEWRKTITSCLLSGSKIICFDNITGKLRSSSLTRALTAKIWTDRHLGQNEMLNLPQKAIWAVTGNNISIGGDIARRSYWIRIDASMARPWLRIDFKHNDLLGWIKANRAAIVADLLIMAKAWNDAGRPAGKGSLGGFKSWSDIVGGILSYANVEGFLDNSTELYDSMDMDVQQWDAFLDAWYLVHGDIPISASALRGELTDLTGKNDLKKAMQDLIPDDLAEALGRDLSRSRNLGLILTKHMDQIYPSGRKLCRIKDTHSKMNLWKVQKFVTNAGCLENAEGFMHSDMREVRDVTSTLHIRERNLCNIDRVEQHPAHPANIAADNDPASSNILRNKTNNIPDAPIKVRITHSDGYLTDIPMPGSKRGYEKHLFNAGEMVDLPAYRAKRLIAEGKAEAV